MASQQLSCVGKTQHIQPKDFNITWGNDSRYWRLPTACDSSAELIKVSFLAIEAKATIEPSRRNRVQICFDVSATATYAGFKNADVRIGARIGSKGDYQFKPISLDGLVLNQCKTVHAEFDLEANPCACDNTTLYFCLFDTWTSHWKFGVKFHEARVTPLIGTC